jgi:hypothetical protein
MFAILFLFRIGSRHLMIVCILYFLKYIEIVSLFLKEGSRLKVDYDVTWDHEGFFRIAQYEPAHSRLGERDASASVHGRKKHYTSRIESDHRKRFRVSHQIKSSI